MAEFDISAQPAASSCRRLDYDSAEVIPGFVTGTWFLVVHGVAPCMNMEVRLLPLIYINCPEYWGIEVTGCLPSGFCLRAIKPYTVTIPLAGLTGSKGIEVLGASKQETFELGGGCTP